MAILAGALITTGNTVLIDRLQTAGPTVNQRTERIYELGNYQSVDIVRDIPDLSFPMESFDVRAEMEAMLIGRDFSADAAGQEYDLSKCVPINVLGEFKKGKLDADLYGVGASAILPGLYVEQIQYRFGLRDNARQTVTLRGDSVFYNNASAYEQHAAGTGAANQTITLANTALPYTGDTVAGTKYALGVTLSTGKRLFLGADYTEAATGATQAKSVTITILVAVPSTTTISVVYHSPTVAEYPQASHPVASAAAPGAIKGKDIEVRVGGLTSTYRWSSVQQVTVDWRVTLDADEEFGNPQYVSEDFDVPDVSGTVDLKPRDVAEMMTKLRQTAGVASGEVIGPLSSAPLSLEILLHSPVDGSVLKTLYTPDAVFTIPGYSGRVQQKFTISLPWASKSGALYAYKGTKP